MRRRQLCQLWPCRPRGGNGRFRLSIDDVGADKFGDVPDRHLRFGAAKRKISTQIGDRRTNRLLWPDRTRSRLRPQRHDHQRPPSGWRLRFKRCQNVDFKFAVRRRYDGLGEGTRRQQQRQRVYFGARHERLVDSKNHRQTELASVDNRTDRHARCVRQRRRHAAQCTGA